MDRSHAVEVLRNHYGIAGDLAALDSGSPNQSWRVNDRYVLKYCVYDASPDWYAFQATTLASLDDAGLPVQRIIPDITGEQTVFAEHGAWQLRPFVAGQDFRLGDPGHLVQAARVMAALHGRPVPEHSPPSSNRDLTDWLACPLALLDELPRALSDLVDEELAGLSMRAYESVAALAFAGLDETGYGGLPACVTHGEYHGNNLLYDRGRMSVLLDWDAVEVRPRVYDVARGAFFLTRRARGRFDLCAGCTLMFLAAYQQVAGPLAPAEIDALTPILEIYFLPTVRYLRLIATHQPELATWYVDWSARGAVQVREVLTPVLARLRAGVDDDCHEHAA